MIKLFKNEDAKNGENSSLEEIGLDMVKLIGLSFFDDKNVSHKVFVKSCKAAFDQEHILQSKIQIFARSSSKKEFKKHIFVLVENGLYKIKVYSN